MTDIPYWRSHKVVQADRIVGVLFSASGVVINRGPATAGPGTPTAIRLACGVEVEIDPIKLFARGAPEVGEDYLVRYDDGYLSWSPAKAFEEGYTLLGGAAPGLGSSHVKMEGARFCPACGVPVNEMDRQPCMVPA